MKKVFLALLVGTGAASCVTDAPSAPSAQLAPTDEKIEIGTREYPYIGYFASMRRAIGEKWHYPLEAVRQNRQGTVEVDFKIQKNGRASDVKVVRSSGYKELDEAIMQAIWAAQPFLPLPAEFHKDMITVSGTFQYMLEDYKAGLAERGKKKHGPKRGLEIK
jgi:TonB family protein